MKPSGITAPTIREDICKLAETLANRIGATSVWLFGSHARGEADPDSDIDLLAVVKDSNKARYQRAVQARRETRKIKLPKDIVVLTQHEWDSGLRAPCSLPSSVAREGIRIL